ncbi:unnamed protein product [Cuscuta campestris]|uniref:Reverse transcriptase Ty1/copia-type domain-containing protein n=1 Tax=Cuscuta campestris TaxID=132261 RepID=A0A484LNC3_9ASTE|nr:unnamed protein product [Cuscuta campestris]
MAEDGRVRIEKFNGTDFAWWKMQIEALLGECDLDIVLEEKPDGMDKAAEAIWDSKDKKARGKITLALTRSVAFNIMKETTARGMLTALSNMYEKPSAGNRVFLMRELFMMRMNEGSPVADHINEVNSILSRLSSVGMKFDDDTQAVILLSSLPDSWSGFVTTVTETAGTGNLKFDRIRDSVLGEDIRRRNASGGSTSGTVLKRRWVLRTKNPNVKISPGNSLLDLESGNGPRCISGSGGLCKPVETEAVADTVTTGLELGGASTVLSALESKWEEEEIPEDSLGFEVLETEPCISFHAVNGIAGYQTMKVTGHFGKKSIQILIDLGSTHNFLDINLARKLGCRLEAISSQPVTVANGSTLSCQYVCRYVKWRLQGTDFFTDVILIPLGSCDIVLGVQWLSTIGTIKWNFKDLQMEFQFKGKGHVLRGLQGPKVKILEGSQLPKALTEACHFCMLQAAPTRKQQNQRWEDDDWQCGSTTTKVTEPKISGLLKQFEELFQEPKGLPPTKDIFDHRIPLKSESILISIRPYRSGKENTVADALSRVKGSELLAMAISGIQSDVLEVIKESYQLDDHLMAIIAQLHQGKQLKAFKGLLPKQPHIPEWLQGRNVAVPLRPTAILESRKETGQKRQWSSSAVLGAVGGPTSRGCLMEGC